MAMCGCPLASQVSGEDVVALSMSCCQLCMKEQERFTMHGRGKQIASVGTIGYAVGRHANAIGWSMETVHRLLHKPCDILSM